MDIITQEALKELLEYRDGKLFWLREYHRVKVGDEAGNISVREDGSRHVLHVLGKMRLRSRVVFYYFNGYFPEMVDHINQDKMDDRIENLRAATRSQNSCNTKSKKGSASKYKGVKYRYGKYWEASIKANGVSMYLGRFKSEVEAALAYNEMARKHHGEFAYLNDVPLSDAINII